MYVLLFRCVSETLLTIARDKRRLGADLGFLAVLHTWNQKSYLTRICIVSFQPEAFLPIAPAGFVPANDSLCPARYSGKCSAASFSRRPFLSSLKKLKWVAEVRPPFGDPEHVLRYLARYTHRVAISNGRLIEMREGQVTFRWRDWADHKTQKPMTVEEVEFIRRFLLHVLPAGFVEIRHFGFLTNCNRGEAWKLCNALLRVAEPPDLLTLRQHNAIERRCLCCKIGTLCLLGYIPSGCVNPPAARGSNSMDFSVMGCHRSTNQRLFRRHSFEWCSKCVHIREVPVFKLTRTDLNRLFCPSFGRSDTFCPLPKLHPQPRKTDQSP
jgi:Putative transposase